MKNPELYKKTVDILYDAYFNNTLEHNSCTACAIGNIVRANTGRVTGQWYHKMIGINTNESNTFGLEEIKSTGYPLRDVKKIENTFERAPFGNSSDDWMFNGLVAVLEVLKEIHEVSDEPHIESVNRFKNHYQTL